MMADKWSIVQTSPDSEGKLEKWLCSPTIKASEKSVVFSNRVSLKRVKLGQVMDSNGNEIDMTDPGVVRKRQSPFRTPPSLSYCHEKVNEHIYNVPLGFFFF